MKENIVGTEPNNAKRNKIIPFKNNAPFINGISKINNKLIDNAEYLDVVMSMYNLLEHSKSYRKTTGSLYNCYWDDPGNLLLLILNLLNTGQALQEILIMLVIVKLVMMQAK